MANSQALPVGIAFPFSIDEFGNVASTTNQNTIWANKVRSVIGTVLKERLFRPDFGSNIPNRMFDSVDVVIDAVNSDVGSAFSKYLPTLGLTEVLINYDDFDNVTTVEILYTLPDETQQSVTIGIASIDGNKIISEVIL